MTSVWQSIDELFDDEPHTNDYNSKIRKDKLRGECEDELDEDELLGISAPNEPLDDDEDDLFSNKPSDAEHESSNHGSDTKRNSAKAESESDDESETDERQNDTMRISKENVSVEPSEEINEDEVVTLAPEENGDDLNEPLENDEKEPQLTKNDDDDDEDEDEERIRVSRNNYWSERRSNEPESDTAPKIDPNISQKTPFNRFNANKTNFNNQLQHRNVNQQYPNFNSGFNNNGLLPCPNMMPFSGPMRHPMQSQPSYLMPYPTQMMQQHRHQLAFMGNQQAALLPTPQFMPHNFAPQNTLPVPQRHNANQVPVRTETRRDDAETGREREKTKRKSSDMDYEKQKALEPPVKKTLSSEDGLKVETKKIEVKKDEVVNKIIVVDDPDYEMKLQEQKRKREEIFRMKELKRLERVKGIKPASGVESAKVNINEVERQAKEKLQRDREAEEARRRRERHEEERRRKEDDENRLSKIARKNQLLNDLLKQEQAQDQRTDTSSNNNTKPMVPGVSNFGANPMHARQYGHMQQYQYAPRHNLPMVPASAHAHAPFIDNGAICHFGMPTMPQQPQFYHANFVMQQQQHHFNGPFFAAPNMMARSNVRPVHIQNQKMNGNVLHKPQMLNQQVTNSYSRAQLQNLSMNTTEKCLMDMCSSIHLREKVVKIDMELNSNKAEIVFKDRESAERFGKQFNRTLIELSIVSIRVI